MDKILALCLILISSHTYSQDFIIEMEQPLSESSKVQLLNSDFEVKETLIKSLNLYLVSPTKKIKTQSLQILQNQLLNTTGVLSVTVDEVLTLREKPNDPLFEKQWSLNGSFGIDASAAWAIGNKFIKTNTEFSLATGKKKKKKPDNSAVVAIVDGLFDVNHEDLKNNIWINRHEIPGNGKDDDKNGFVDDINGWNFYHKSGKIVGGSRAHGTRVIGVVGAVGNNKKHITGVDWNAKMMLVQGSSRASASETFTSTVMRSYGYILEHKKLWLKTKGQRGANVIAINSSFGKDRADCLDSRYAIWNKVYNKLGKNGILSVVATSNSSYDVDVHGDVPSGCKSRFIISLASIDEIGKLQSAYGKKHVDLVAPGHGVLTTTETKKTTQAYGTSFATPQVTGAISYLFKVSSKKFKDFYSEKPGKAMLKLKKIILNTADPIKSVKGKVKTSGSLNLFKATQSIIDFK